MRLNAANLPLMYLCSLSFDQEAGGGTQGPSGDRGQGHGETASLRAAANDCFAWYIPTLTKASGSLQVGSTLCYSPVSTPVPLCLFLVLANMSLSG